MNKRKYEICGREQDVNHNLYHNKENNLYVCRKHRYQLEKYGKITDPSRTTTHDKNIIEKYNDHAEIIIRNIDNIEIARALIDLEDVSKCEKYKWCLSNGYVINTGKNKTSLHRCVMGYKGDLEIDHINRNKLDNRKSNLRIVEKFINSTNNNAKCVRFDTGTHSSNKWIAEFSMYGTRHFVGLFENYDDAIEAVQTKKEEISKNQEKLIAEWKNKKGECPTGISLTQNGNRWKARIAKNGKYINLGTFDTKEEAMKARQLAIEQLKSNQLPA